MESLSASCRQVLSGPSSFIVCGFLVASFGISATSAQQIPQPGAPAGDITNLPKDVTSTMDQISLRGGSEPPNGRKPTKNADTCLLPPLTQIAGPTVAAEQLRIPAKAKNEYQRACVALSKRKYDEAEARLRTALREYAKYSAARVTLGQLLTMQKRSDEAQNACSQASIADPKYAPAFLCLAELASIVHNWEEVLKLSNNAVQIDPANDAVAYEYHAAANLRLHHLAEAEKSGLLAVEIDKEHREPRLHFVLAQIYEAKGDTANERQQLREYLKYADNPDDIAVVKQALAEIENRTARSQSVVAARQSPVGSTEYSRLSWGPPDVDQFIPPVSGDSGCPLPEILKKASNRTEELIENLQRFVADEHIEQIEFDKNGKSRHANSVVVNYVAQMDNNASGYPTIREYRSGAGGTLKGSVMDTGTATFALIFHPSHIGSFQFRCEGLAQLKSSAAWQLRFEEGTDPNSSFQAIRVGGSIYLPRLKGRAWIATDSYEVVRMETDLASPISGIGLDLEHLVIGYAPVEFRNHTVRLWLPESASLYIAYRGHRYQREHKFNHFQLFSVDSAEEVKEPVAPAKDATSQLMSVESKVLEATAGPR